jgi:acetyl-CoA acetyltransferase
VTLPRVAVVGAAESDFGRLSGVTALELHVQAASRALADAGLTKDDVDGLFTSGAAMSGVMPEAATAEYMGLHPRYLEGTNTGGSVFESMLGHSVAALQGGACTVALIVYGATPRSSTITRYNRPGTPSSFEEPFGLTLPGRAGMVAGHYMHRYGVTGADLARVAVSIRRNASLNPLALNRELITVEDVLESRMIADPIHKLDCCVVTDGGGALVVTTEERAADLPSEPVWVLGYGEALATETFAAWQPFGEMVAGESGNRAFEMAGVTPADVNVLQLYDAFTINVLLQLEALGFCKPGEARDLVQDGTLDFDGSLPTNTDGGGLSSNHPGMRGIFLLIEAVRQLRGRGGAAQVEDAAIALCNGTGGPYSMTGTVILGKDGR